MTNSPLSAPEALQPGHASNIHQPDATPVWWARPATVAGFVVILIMVKLGMAAATDFVRDEAYYSLWALHPLQPGYFDHPPAVAWFIKAGYWLLGPSEFAARFFAILSTALVSAAIHRIAMIGFSDLRVAAFSIYLFNLAPGALIGLLVITPDAPSILFWALALWAAAELIRSRTGYWWLGFGLFAGLGLDAKYTGLFLGAGIVLWLVADPSARRWLWSPWLYAGGAFAMALFAPVILWNADNGQSSFTFQLGRSTRGFEQFAWRELAHLPEFIAAQAGLLLPGLFILGCSGFAPYFLKRPLRENAVMGLLVLTAVPALIYFAFHTLHSAAQGNWAWPLYAQWAILGGWACIVWNPATAMMRLVQSLTLKLQVPVGALICGLFFVQALFQPIVTPFNDQTREMAGWHTAIDKIAETSAETGLTTILVQDYGMYGRLASYKVFDDHAYTALPLNEFHRYGFVTLPRNDGSLEWPVMVAVPAPAQSDNAAPAGLPLALQPFDPAPEFLQQIVRLGADGTPASAINLYRLAQPQPPVFGN